MGAVGAGTHRSLGHHLLYPLIFWFLVLCAPADFGNPENRLHPHPQIQIPNAFPEWGQAYLEDYLDTSPDYNSILNLPKFSGDQSLRCYMFRRLCAQPSRPSGQGGHQRIQEDFDTLGMFANVTGSLLHVEISDRINLNYWK